MTMTVNNNPPMTTAEVTVYLGQPDRRTTLQLLKAHNVEPLRGSGSARTEWPADVVHQLRLLTAPTLTTSEVAELLELSGPGSARAQLARWRIEPAGRTVELGEKEWPAEEIRARRAAKPRRRRREADPGTPR